MLTPVTSGYAPVNGVEIYYEVYGEGEPLILIHGGFGSTGMFAPIMPALASGRQVIAMDMQAHGRTGPLGRPMTFENMAADVAGLIHFLGFEKADVMGYSMGGGVALRTAIDHPEVVDRLVLVSTAFAYRNLHDYNQQGTAQIANDPVGAAESLKQTPMYQAWLPIARDPGLWPAMVAEVGSLVAKDYDWSAEVPKVTAPTLVVVGDWDAIRISAATRLFEMLGGGKQDAMWDRSGVGKSRFAVLPNTTHYEMFLSAALAPVVTSFLDGYPNAGPSW